MKKQILIPDWKLERFLLGELPESTMDAVRRHLASNPSEKLRLEHIKKELAICEQELPELKLNLQTNSSPRDSAEKVNLVSRLFSLFQQSPALAFGLLLLLVTPLVFHSMQNPNSDQDQVALADIDTIRSKGDAQLHLYKHGDENISRLSDSSTLKQGDIIQIKYIAAGQKYGTIVSIDGRDQLTRHLPISGDSAAALEIDKAQLLDFSYKLDDAPKFEKFWFITSDSPFALDSIFAQVKNAETDSIHFSKNMKHFEFMVFKAEQ